MWAGLVYNQSIGCITFHLVFERDVPHPYLFTEITCQYCFAVNINSCGCGIINVDFLFIVYWHIPFLCKFSCSRYNIPLRFWFVCPYLSIICAYHKGVIPSTIMLLHHPLQSLTPCLDWLPFLKWCIYRCTPQYSYSVGDYRRNGSIQYSSLYVFFLILIVSYHKYSRVCQ